VDTRPKDSAGWRVGVSPGLEPKSAPVGLCERCRAEKAPLECAVWAAARAAWADPNLDPAVRALAPRRRRV
jgi:hypothetical protein